MTDLDDKPNSSGLRGLSLLDQGIGAYASGGRIGPAQWPHHDLIVVTRGSATFQTDQREFHCAGGSSLLIPPGFSFSGLAEKHGCVIWIQHFAVGKGWLPVGLPKRPESWIGTANFDWPRALLREIHERKIQSSGDSPGLPHLLILLLMALSENATTDEPGADSGPGKVRAVTDWLEQHPHPLPSLESLAKRSGWSTSHFRAEFRRYRGFSVGFHTRTLRMREASRLLRESNLPIKEIAGRLGYGDVIAFHRAFTSSHGETPAVYRAKAPRAV